MKLKLFLLYFLLIDFAVYSGWVMLEYGYFGIWKAGFANPASMQVLFDLVIGCLLISGWMLADAKRRGVNAWPWVIATLVAGTLAPLVYLIRREYAVINQPASAIANA
ncbi:MAG: DUF2834 domain-containing protein [Nevskiales bacterium]